jgi:hypothetical protein
MRVEELAEDPDRARLGDRVGIGDQDVVAGRGGGAGVRVRRERERTLVLDDAYAVRQVWRETAPRVRDDDELVDLGCEPRQRALELVGVPVRDDDGRDAQSASR